MDWRVLHNECRFRDYPSKPLGLDFTLIVVLVKLCKVAAVCAMLHNIRIDERLVNIEDFDLDGEDNVIPPNNDRVPAQIAQIRAQYIVNNFNR